MNLNPSECLPEYDIRNCEHCNITQCNTRDKHEERSNKVLKNYDPFYKEDKSNE